MLRVSVCIAAFNGEKFIGRQLQSIRGQLGEGDEIVLSDDGSTDRTLEIVRQLHDPRIRVVGNALYKGVVGNFENALEASRGQYVFLADQDDIWQPDKLDVMLAYLQNYDLVVSDCSLIDAGGKCIHPSYFSLRGSGKGVLKNIRANSYVGACMAFNRRVLENAMPFPKYVPMHDWWIGLVGELSGKTLFCSEKLIQYRRHDNNQSQLNSPNSVARKLRFRKNLLLPLAGKWVQLKYRDWQSKRKALK